MKNGTLAWLASLLFFGCSSAPAPGDVCSRASDCAAPLTCQLGHCRASCRSPRDCPTGARCLAGSIGGVCSLDDEARCTSASCAAPLRCEDGQCRTQCVSDSDCLAGTCVSATCVEPISGQDAGITPRDAGTDAVAPVLDAGSDAFVEIDAAIDAPADDTDCDGC